MLVEVSFAKTVKERRNVVIIVSHMPCSSDLVFQLLLPKLYIETYGCICQCFRFLSHRVRQHRALFQYGVGPRSLLQCIKPSSLVL